MKLQKTIIFLSILLLHSVANAQKVDVTNALINKIGDNVTISFDANVSKVSTNYMLTLTPTLWNGEDTQSLRQIIVMGRNKRITQARIGVVDSRSLLHKSNELISYSTTIPFEKWMGSVSLRMDGMLKGCCEREILPSFAIANKRLTPNLLPVIPVIESDLRAVYIKEFQPTISNYPFVYLSGDKANNDGLKIHFKQNITVIDELYADNTYSLLKIKEAVASIQSNPNFDITKIIIAGGTSPEGSYAYNKKMGQRRAESVVNYLSQDVDIDIFEVTNVGENWSGLYSIVENSDMEYRDEVLHIIDNNSIFKGREKKLMDLANGKPYRYMLKEFFPELRKASYIQVFYDLKQSYEFKETDRALKFIESKNYSEALDILKEITPTPYTNNLIGVCYMMLEDETNARIYLQKAIDGGDSDAQENLNKLSYQRDNIKYF